MTDKRIPKPGEVWTYGSGLRPVVNVYPDAVTYTIHGHLNATTLDGFLDAYTPPEPTVVETRWLSPASNMFFIDRIGPHDDHTHRLDLMSDGEFRVVKL